MVKKRIERPIGVSIMTICDALFLGLLPLIGLYSLARQQEGEFPIVYFVLLITMCLIIIASSIGAWLGEGFARRLLLRTVGGLTAMIVYYNFRELLGGDVVGAEIVKPVGYVIRGIFWVVINLWYFNRKGVLEYYNQDATS